ncbi:CHAP domain-containing protein [Staphylococcus agnetis]|uniref:CHAP domain-containing protein n=1 Tax=Staphylococcus agnetis TaxID=985762 RepID=A0ABX3Z0V7_9STAP|nr:CHAP domain-containing protein [Staphylococcus agnetis]MDG4943919.1 CHAP domain-containing protein [Staphylococcus agnetis]OSP22573.1 CHAP domain-containing protein [Staphylococcus agnetis]OSP23136.1 CHAP domain-containing protein [Staphylococcus agnetis]OTW30533.1 CHAP domain-containing protein [Staphylococcus agnetis]
MKSKKIIVCALSCVMAFTSFEVLHSVTPKASNIAVAAEIDKYPRPIKSPQANYHWKNNCTWYVHNKRNQTKRYLPSHFTHAKDWLGQAQKAGFKTGRKPIAGAVLQTPKGGNGLGHVAFVERVNKDGSIFISEYNYNVRLGYGTRTLTKAQAATYNYIY